MKTQKSHDLQIAGLFLAVLIATPFLVADSRYLLSVLMNCMGLSLIAFGVWLTFTIGRINICQAGFALIGGYVTAILLTRLELSFSSGISERQKFYARFKRHHRFASTVR